MLDEALKDKCGIFGISNVNNLFEYIYLGLHNLQHRGQEGYGIVAISQKGIRSVYGKGIINGSLTKKQISSLKGNRGIAHVRYPTVGSSSLDNRQPIISDTPNGIVALAHNGQISNYENLKEELIKKGHVFKSTSDSEVILHKFADARGNSLEKILYETFKDVGPSYSIVMLTEKELIGIKDRSNVKPLSIGYLEKENSYALASESVAFDIINAKLVGEVKPGEAVIIKGDKIKREQLFEPQIQQKCIFEYIYFSRPDSFIFGDEFTTSEVRKEFGRQLYRESPLDADIIIPVPDSSIDIALGYSYESRIPFDWGLVRNHYIGRTFIEPTQEIRNSDILKKLNVNKSIIKGKRVVIVDDSLVRGNTMKNIIHLMRKNEAKEVHVRIGSPPYRNSCYLGIETSNRDELIAHDKSVDEIMKHIQADSLYYLSKKGMLSNKYLGDGFCTYCFDGKEIILK